MFTQKDRDIWEKLNLSFPAVAVRFCRNIPEGYEVTEEKGMLCEFLVKAQKNNKPYLMAVDNEQCMGKVVMGMKDLEPMHGSGTAGARMDAFCSPAANARLYYDAPMFKRGIVNFVLFCPVAQCDFDPDLIVVVTETDSAHKILRASSYRTGDVWESKCSYVMSCSWTYVYPYISGKINHLFTGMHMGLKRLGAYPAGLHILSIPYGKIHEVIDSLYEMKWDLEAVSQDPKDQEYMSQLMSSLDDARDDIYKPVSIKK